MLTLAAAGQPPTTTELRRIQLVRMARDIGGRPADVAGEKFVEWFGRQTGWTIETRRSYRAGIRGFFRWAYRTKRVPDHLADELPKVREQRGQRGRRQCVVVHDGRGDCRIRRGGPVARTPLVPCLGQPTFAGAGGQE